MNTKPIYNLQTGRQSAIYISGNYSIEGVAIMLELLEAEFGGDVELAFHVIKRMQNSGLMPRMGSEDRPLTARDFELYRRNVELGKRHWRWIQLEGWDVREATGYDFVYGYGYQTDAGEWVIVDKNDNPTFIVKKRQRNTPSEVEVRKATEVLEKSLGAV